MADAPEDNPKPDLKVVSIEEKKRELQDLLLDEKEWTSQLVQCYAVSKKLFAEIDDPVLMIEASSYLRKAFLLALNPLQQVDDEFDMCFGDIYEDEYED